MRKVIPFFRPTTVSHPTRIKCQRDYQAEPEDLKYDFDYRDSVVDDALWVFTALGLMAILVEILW